MSFTASTPHPDLARFRDRMTLAARATSAYVEQADLHEDLVSLVEALDAMLDN